MLKVYFASKRSYAPFILNQYSKIKGLKVSGLQKQWSKDVQFNIINANQWEIKEEEHKKIKGLEGQTHEEKAKYKALLNDG